MDTLYQQAIADVAEESMMAAVERVMALVLIMLQVERLELPHL